MNSWGWSEIMRLENQLSGLFLPQFRLKSEIFTTLGVNAIAICDEATNLKSVEAEMALLYH